MADLSPQEQRNELRRLAGRSSLGSVVVTARELLRLLDDLDGLAHWAAQEAEGATFYRAGYKQAQKHVRARLSRSRDAAKSDIPRD